MVADNNVELLPSPGERRRRRRRRRWLAFMTLFLTLVAVGVVTAYVTVTRRFIPEADPEVAFPQGRITVLAMGADERAADTGRADTIMVISFDVRSGEAEVLSIPRDTRVRIPGSRGYTKINAAYARGGVRLVKATVEQLLGIPIDYYVKVDFEGFERVVDALGGVEIDVEKRMKYTDRAQNLNIDLKPGLQRLNGRQALHYVRFRHDALGDVSAVDPNRDLYGGRVERQLKFIRALAKQALRPGTVVRLPRLVPRLQQAIETDLPVEKMVPLAVAARRATPESIHTYVLPGVGRTIGGVSYWVVDERRKAEVLARFRHADGGQSDETVAVEVLNGTDVNGMAARAASWLQGQGFKVVAIGNADQPNYARTEVIPHDEEEEADAARLAKLLNGRIARRSVPTGSTEADVTVILGRDFRI